MMSEALTKLLPHTKFEYVLLYTQKSYWKVVLKHLLQRCHNSGGKVRELQKEPIKLHESKRVLLALHHIFLHLKN
jgi:hypothetical protein